MSESNKLTVADVEALLVHGVNGVIEERAHDLARQLAQVMRENARLKQQLEDRQLDGLEERERADRG